MALAEHAETGEESCGRGDWRMAAPIGIDPELSAVAAKVSAEFGGRWLVFVEPGGFRAVLRTWPGEPGRARYGRTALELAEGMRSAEEQLGVAGGVLGAAGEVG